MEKPKCILTVDVEALRMRAPSCHVDTLIYGRIDGGVYGIGRMMDIADRHGVKMTFFLDFAEVELYGDEIIEAGRYIVSRGHDLQVHCHYEFLREKVLERFPDADESYYTWYESEEISAFILDYCLAQYRKCAASGPIVFRGGEYRFGEALVKKLAEKGFAADASYNFLRPQRRPDNRQFVYENGLLAFPVGLLSKQAHPDRIPLNFNFETLYPTSPDAYNCILREYASLFCDFYQYYGKAAVASMLLHSWAFCYDRERFQITGYIDRPNPCAAQFFDRFLETFCAEIDFISMAEAVRLQKEQSLKKVDLDALFSCGKTKKMDQLRALRCIEAFIKEKAKGRRIVIWGRGWLERQNNETLNFHRALDIPFYISRDAASVCRWRGKPVKAFEEAKLSPEKYYVFVMAQARFAEIREQLKASGFVEYEDFYDIEQPLPQSARASRPPRKMPVCPICGGVEYVAYSSQRPRRCVGCGSLERQRTAAKLFSENLMTDRLPEKLLHISPSSPERRLFRQLGIKRVVTVDIRPQVKPDVLADLCDMPQIKSGSFDMVFANCVLNHVYDDATALAEIRRVLREDGLFVAWVMGSGGMKTTVDEDPTEWYGDETMQKYRVGTYRHYGEADFTAQLKRCFASVRSYEKYDAVTETSCCWYVCEK